MWIVLETNPHPDADTWIHWLSPGQPGPLAAPLCSWAPEQLPAGRGWFRHPASQTHSDLGFLSSPVTMETGRYM